MSKLASVKIYSVAPPSRRLSGGRSFDCAQGRLSSAAEGGTPSGQPARCRRYTSTVRKILRLGKVWERPLPWLRHSLSAGSGYLAKQLLGFRKQLSPYLAPCTNVKARAWLKLKKS
jgi:hypothetical protein